MSNRPLTRDEPSRGFGLRRDDDSRITEPPPSRSSNPWSRPPSRSYRPGPGQSRTPSPPRRFDPPPSDTRRFGSGPTHGPRDRDRDWDNRRWDYERDRERDRDRDRDRFRDYSPPRNRRLSPPPPRTHSPPRGPRALNNAPASYASTPTPRIPPPKVAYQGRDIRFDRPGPPGPGPSTVANQQQQSIPPPRAPRSMRGSSSPVESRNTWSTVGPSSVPTRNVELPVEVKEEEGDDLEEGEVVSPVRKSIDPPPLPRPGGDRWAPPRRSLSPRRRRLVSRPGSPDFRNRSRDRGWRNARRSMSPIVSRPKIEPTERLNSVERDIAPSAPTVAARPPTPPVATSLPSLPLPPSRPETPLLPEIPPRRGSVQRPTTPELPQLQPPTEREVAAVTVEVGLEEVNASPTKDAATLSEPIAAELDEQKPTLPESKPLSPRSPPLEMRRSPLASLPTGLDTVPPQIDNNPDVDSEPTVPTTSRPREIRVTIDPIVQHTLISPPAYNTTIAERRSVRLPENVVPRPPSRDRFRQGSMPSARSVSSQPETPQTAEPRDDPLSGHLSDGAMEEAHEAGVITAVSTSQKMRMRLNFDALPTWNDLVGPRRPARERVYIHRSEVTNDLDELMDVMPVMRSVESEKQHLATKVKGLRLDYRYHALDWSFHHKLLTEQMEPRGPVPPDTFVMEDMPASEHENYQGDPTIAEDGATVGRRGGRRDGLIANSDAAIDDVINRSMQLNARDPVAQSWANKAAIPDMELEGICEYDDENDLVLDPLEFYDFDGVQEKIWTPDERAVFRRTFPNCLKQFGKIADKLPDKTVGDCVQYYYRTKKDLDWKGIVNKKGGGAPKKPKPPLTKSKGPTLLNNLDKPKTATNAANAGGRSTITPARKGQGPRIRETIGTPVDSGRRRKQSGLDSVDGQGSETSRAGSEVPAVAAKSKMRMSIKGKRPRVSSISGTPAAMSAEASVAESVDEPLPTGPPTPQMPGDPQAELLPPARRAGKKRKMTVTDGTGGSVGPEDKGDNKPKRQSTSSYWSVEEKKLVLRLLTIYPDSLEKIAEQIAGKSVRQVQNFIASRGEVSDAGPVLSTSAFAYDVNQQPRLGTFNDSTNDTSPSKSQFRPGTGGMRISALLNDDADTGSSRGGNLDNMDAASDGTVEDEGMGMRPPSRSVPSRPTSTPTTGAAFDRPRSTSTNYPPPRAGSEHDQYQSQRQYSYPPQSQAHPGQAPPPPQGYYSTPSSRPYNQSAPGWEYGHPPSRPSHGHGHGHLPPPSALHAHYPPGGHSYPSHRPHPQMGTFAPPHPGPGPGGIASNFGRTIYDQNRERGRIAPPAPQKDRNRSEGPAFTGFPQAQVTAQTQTQTQSQTQAQE